MAPLTAADRLRRLLAVIPWVAESDGPAIEEVVKRFDYPRSELLEDLEHVVYFVGIHPFTPDCLIEVTVADERVWIRYADWFRRPMRLSVDELTALHAAGRSVTAISGTDELGPLERALTKLAASMGPSDDLSVEVRLGDGRTDTIGVLREAIADRRSVRIDYYSYGRDEAGPRLVDPYRLYADKGHWYLTGHCHSAADGRVFRLDRISACEPTDLGFERAEDVEPASAEIPRDGSLPEVHLELEAGSRWVVEEYPHTGIEELEKGRARVRLPVASLPWLERLLLRLGPSATVLGGDEAVGTGVAAAAAGRILDRYGS